MLFNCICLIKANREETRGIRITRVPLVFLWMYFYWQMFGTKQKRQKERIENQNVNCSITYLAFTTKKDKPAKYN